MFVCLFILPNKMGKIKLLSQMSTADDSKECFSYYIEGIYESFNQTLKQKH